ncbi:hypothetical protein [Pseudovibrio sp. Tun.PSC04-5.I4]|uniref:hypothetical protein n=1 Tax=Pseudovibrio sp. Tun.PSC04-5.I4 TaxID=1798213 RepID=UPI00088A37EA|nr:hypothetical protein [Pseudovibrio sp. Tun.PSC04-5.I4]SDR22038.1 hypothetical protein SAMN04515695_3509 [Pseudovibrio sp. Tun.PSC04-5.I4]
MVTRIGVSIQIINAVATVMLALELGGAPELMVSGIDLDTFIALVIGADPTKEQLNQIHK